MFVCRIHISSLCQLPYFVLNVDGKAWLQVVDGVLDKGHQARRLGERQACITRLDGVDKFFAVNLAFAEAERHVLDCNVSTRADAVELSVEVDGFKSAFTEIDIEFDGLDWRKRYVAEINAEHADER